MKTAHSLDKIQWHLENNVHPPLSENAVKGILSDLKKLNDGEKHYYSFIGEQEYVTIMEMCEDLRIEIVSDSEALLNSVFGEHCGLNANWSIMAWPVKVEKDKGLFIAEFIPYADSEPPVIDRYDVTERSYREEDWSTDREFKTLFTGTAEQCILFALGKVYEDIVGYDIIKDDPNITVEKILQTMREYDLEAEEKPFNQCYKNTIP